MKLKQVEIDMAYLQRDIQQLQETITQYPKATYFVDKWKETRSSLREMRNEHYILKKGEKVQSRLSQAYIDFEKMGKPIS